MRLFVLVLNDIDKLDDLMKRFQEEKISGATIVNSSGMVHALAEIGDESLFGSLRHLLDMDRQENKMILMVLNESKVKFTLEIIEDVIGNLDKAHTGIAFTLPLDFVKGAYGLETKAK